MPILTVQQLVRSVDPDNPESTQKFITHIRRKGIKHILT